MCDWRQVNHSEVERESSDFPLSFTIHRGWNEDGAIDEHYNASDDNDEDGGGKVAGCDKCFFIARTYFIKN